MLADVVQQQNENCKRLSKQREYNLAKLEMLWEAREGGSKEADMDTEYEATEQAEEAGDAGLNMCNLDWSPIPRGSVDVLSGALTNVPMRDGLGPYVGTRSCSPDGPAILTPHLAMGPQYLLSTLSPSFTAVVSLVQDPVTAPPHVEAHLRLPVADGPRNFLGEVIGTVFDFFLRCHREGRRVYVHCVAGLNRSALVSAALLMTCYRVSACLAVQYISAKRGCSVLMNPTFRRELTYLDELLSGKA